MHASSPSSWSPSQRGDTANSSYSGSKGQNFSRPPRREEFKAYVKNVPSHITKESLEAFFQSCGTVVSCHVLEPKEGRNSTVGFVGFSSEEEVNNAIQTMNGTTLEGSQLAVERAIQRDRGAGTPMRGQENQYQGPKTGFQHSAGGEEFKAYVKNVPAHITKESLEAFFQSCGTVVSCHVMEPKEGRNSTVGFVGFSSEEEVNNAIQTMNGTSLESNQLTVERAIQRDRGTGTPMRGQENRYQGPRTDFQHSAGFQNGQPSHQGYRPKQYEQPHNYTQQPGGVKVEQAIFNPRGPGRGIPMQSPGPNPVPGRDSNYVNGVPNEYSNNTQGPANPASWTNQGPQQWDQSNSVDNQHMPMNGQFPQGPMSQEPYNQQQQPQFQNGALPQEPYNQTDPHGQFQNGPANPPSWSNQQPQQWDQANQQLPMSGQFQQGPMPQEPYDQQQQQPQFQNGPENPPSWTNQGPQQWDQTNSVDNQHMGMAGQFPQGPMPQEPYNQQPQQPQFQNGPPSWSNQGPQQWDQSNSVDNQQIPINGQFPQGPMPQEPYNQTDPHGQFQNGPMPQEPYNQHKQHGQFQNGPANPASWSDQGPQQWDQTNSVNNQQMSGRLPYNTMPQEPYTQQEQKPRFQGGGQSCHKCGEVGHFARDCPTQGEQGGRGGQSCHKCGEVGHFARDCPTQGEQGGRGGQNCHKCGEVGHFARDCPTQGEQRGRGDQSCFKCGETGHFSRECTSSGVLDKTCRKCGEEGHFARECPAVGNATSPGQKGDQSCFKCGETGHFSRECPSSEGTENRVPPVTYIPPELPNVDELFQDAPHSGLNFDKYDDIPVQVTGKDPVPPISTFEEAGILEQCSANIKKAQFIKPTPIQKYAIPITLQGRDLMACAQTGSGKTVAFLVPVLTTMIKQGHLSGGFLTGETQAPTALCIAPTRELAIQIYKEVCKFSNGTVVTAAVCYGGVSVQHQLDKLRRGCHILVATPGRLHDFVGRNRVSLANVRYLILDEADRMLDMGFEPEIRKLVERCGMPDKTNRQTLMFSATFPDEIQRLAADFLKEDYLFVAVGRIGGSNLDITQTVISVPGDDKQEKLFEILLNSGTDRTLIFVELKRVADFLACLLSQNNFPTTSISGDRTQQEREAALRDFRSGRAPVLVATSVAARGLDIPDVKHVINFDLPQDIEEYVHRIGRTGRIGNKGRATSFFQPGKDERLARSLVKVLSEAYQEVPEWLEQVAEEAIGSSYGPAGGKFASKDRRERDHSRPSYSADVMGGVNRGMARLDVNAHSQPRPSPSHNSNSAAAEDEEEWD
ncbi:uncharacterized protein LOC144638600 isoform X2 [Oculina patagonica]